MHCHRDHGMERTKCSSQRRSEWPQHFHLCAAIFRGHIHHKGGRRCSAATDHVYHSVLTVLMVRRAGIAQAVASLRLSLFIRHDPCRQSLPDPAPPTSRTWRWGATGFTTEAGGSSRSRSTAHLIHYFFFAALAAGQAATHAPVVEALLRICCGPPLAGLLSRLHFSTQAGSF